MVAGPQRRFFARRSGGAGAADDHGPALRPRGGQRGSAKPRSALHSQLDASHVGRAPPASGIRTRHLTNLFPKNRKILAYLREYGDETILCVANVAHSSQAVELDLSQFNGRVPVELNAGTPFPPIGELTYLLTLPPYGFYWFALAKASDWPAWHTPAPEPMEEFVTIVLRDHLAGAVTSTAKRMIENDVLPPYVAKRRWFGLKDETIKSARIASVLKIADRDREILLSEIEIKTSGGNTTRWQLPLSILWENEASAALPQRLALARVRKGRHLGFLTDAFALPDFARKYIACLAESCKFENAEGTVCFRPTDAGQRALATLPEGDINWLAAEQSNSSLIVADAVMLKIYRRISPGIHPGGGNGSLSH